MDTLKTSINREYALRFLGVAALFVGFAGWFLYDGRIGYPGKNAEVAPVARVLAARDLTPADWMNTAKTGTAPLTEAFRSMGMVNPPAKIADTFTSWVRAGDPRANRVEEARRVLLQPVYGAEDIRAQFVGAAVALVAALGLLALVAVRFLTRHALDGEALTVSTPLGTRRYPLASLETVDDTQWVKRGILRLRFASGAVTLDAWHHAGIRAFAERLLALRQATPVELSAPPGAEQAE